MPVVLGEVDVIKSLLLRVTNAGEGASGFYCVVVLIKI
jgi:hypothetical protein